MNDFTQWFKDLDDQFWNVGHYSKLSFFQRQFLAEQENRERIFELLIKAIEIKSEVEYCSTISQFIERTLIERTPCIKQAFFDLKADAKAGKLFYHKWDFEKEDKWINETKGEINARICTSTAE